MDNSYKLFNQQIIYSRKVNDVDVEGKLGNSTEFQHHTITETGKRLVIYKKHISEKQYGIT